MPDEPVNAVTPASPLMALPVGVLCPDCGYDLRGSTSPRCPECGLDLEVVRTRESQIPWSRRGELGWLRSYWRTVWRVTVTPKLFSLEMARGVDYRDSQLFRWTTLAHAIVPLAAALVALLVFDPADLMAGGSLARWFLGGALLMLVLWLAALPGLASYFFMSPRLTMEQGNRAIALCYYAWGPLAWTLLALPPLAMTIVTWQPWGMVHVAFLVVTVAIYVVSVALCERKLFRFSRYTLRRSWFGSLIVVGIFNVLAIVLLALLAIVPISIFWLAVVWYSFTA